MGQVYYERTKGNPKHGLGSPHLHIWGALLQEIIEDERAEATDVDLIRKAQEDHYKTYEMTAYTVKFCTAKPTWDTGVHKITWNVHEATRYVSDVLEKVLLGEEGAELKLSAQPKGPRERRLDAVMRKLQNCQNKGEGKGLGREEDEDDW